MTIGRSAGIAALHGAAVAGVAGVLTLIPVGATQASGMKQPAADTACIALYKPVCAVKNGTRKTYSNRCYATRAGARVVIDEPCPTQKGAGQQQSRPR